jgi:hypothetical protein
VGQVVSYARVSTARRSKSGLGLALPLGLQRPDCLFQLAAALNERGIATPRRGKAPDQRSAADLEAKVPAS